MEKRHLPRLPPEFYRGCAYVHWTLSIANRSVGWLTPSFHLHFREILLHSSCRYRLTCPAYVLMPDHAHLLWVGISSRSDQRLAVEHLRRHSGPHLAPAAWQHQAHDHVLRERHRERGSVACVAAYILENPLRAGLVDAWRQYPFLGAIVPGYPELDPRAADHWERFWRCHAWLVEAGVRSAGDREAGGG